MTKWNGYAEIKLKVLKKLPIKVTKKKIGTLQRYGKQYHYTCVYIADHMTNNMQNWN